MSIMREPALDKTDCWTWMIGPVHFHLDPTGRMVGTLYMVQIIDIDVAGAPADALALSERLTAKWVAESFGLKVYMLHTSEYNEDFVFQYATNDEEIKLIATAYMLDNFYCAYPRLEISPDHKTVTAVVLDSDGDPEITTTFYIVEIGPAGGSL